MKKSILTPILAVADIVLLAVIVISTISAGNTRKDISVTTAEESVTEESTAERTEGNTKGDTEETYVETESSITESSMVNTDEEEWLNPGSETKGFVQKEHIRDISQYDTRDLPHIKDFKWINSEIREGDRPVEAEEVLFEESLGGWKCYIIYDETEMERLANIEISGTEEDIELTIDWYYIRSGGKTEDAYEDTAPDSVYTGYVNKAGEIEAQGTGSIHVTDIYAIGDHMYAFGTIGWPDGIKGSLFMVRP